MKMSVAFYQLIVYLLACSVIYGTVDCASVIGNVDGKTHGESIASQSRERFSILGVFGHPGKSHFDVFEPLLEELARRGHNVTVVSHFPRNNSTSPLPNYRDISLISENSNVYKNVINLNTIHHSWMSTVMELYLLRNWGLKHCEEELHHPNVQKFLKTNDKFDLIITETFNTDCFLGFVHHFKAPFISLSSHQLMPWANHRIANDDNPSYIPSLFQGFDPTTSFFERLTNTLSVSMSKIFYEFMYNIPTQAIVEEVFGPGVPPLSEIAKNTLVIFVNTHYSLHGSRPQLPNIIEVGGIHIPTTVKPLPEDLQKFLDDADEGVLYFNLGSMIKASTMPSEKLASILKVLGSIPRKVIWKWEAESLPNKPANLLVRTWLPQASILRHRNVKCFMAHGGLLGVSEGVHAGVPMVIMPMYGDQFHNAAAARSRGVAEVLKWQDLDENTFRTALDRVFNESRYEVNARALAKAYLDRPETALEKAVWWTEYIARGNGNPYLKSAAQHLTWYQYYLLDVIFFVIIIGLVALFVTYSTIKFFLSKIKTQPKTEAKIKNGTIPSKKKTTKRE